VKDKNQKILGLFKLSIGNTVKCLYNNNDKANSLNQNIKIIYFKQYLKKNIGKMIYKINENKKEINILSETFMLNNIKRTKVILSNKQYDLKQNIESKKKDFKIKINFLDNIIKLNSMFSGCKSLSSVHNFHNLNTKYLKSIDELFCECSSLLYIDDISNWNINNIDNFSSIFHQCFSLENLPNISKWNISNATNISGLFDGCSSLEELPDISN